MASKKLPSDDEFVNALKDNASLFGQSLREDDVRQLLYYFKIVSRWNARLHLVAPCSPHEFATRHVLESLLAITHLPFGAQLIDVGTGAGLPAIPCLVMRPDLHATLIDSSTKKGVFLREALRELGRSDRASVRSARFEQLEPPVADVFTCRAIEKFNAILPRLVEWTSQIKTLILFGGVDLEEGLKKLALEYSVIQIPDAERRFLFLVER